MRGFKYTSWYEFVDEYLVRIYIERDSNLDSKSSTRNHHWNDDQLHNSNDPRKEDGWILSKEDLSRVVGSGVKELECMLEEAVLLLITSISFIFTA